MLLKDLGIELLPPIKTRDELIKRRDELERRNQKEACGEKYVPNFLDVVEAAIERNTDHSAIA